MAKVTDSELIKLLGWPQGIDNLTPDEQLPIGKRGAGGQVTGSLRVADNLNIDDSGHVSRRDGYSQIAALSDLHSLYATKQFPLMLAVYNDALVAFDETLARTTLATLTASTPRMSYDYDAGWVYFTNGFDKGRISPTGVVEPWAVAPPIGQPDVSQNAAGGLYAGTYQVAITYLDTHGRESGSGLAAEIDVAAGSGILLSNIPQPVEAIVTTIRVYCTDANGEVMRYVADIPAGTTAFAFGYFTGGKDLSTQFQEVLPAGQIVRLYRGRMFVVRDRVLYASAANHYGQAELFSSYISFNAPGTMLEGVHVENETGLYATFGKRTYFLTGPDPQQWQKAVSHPYGAVPGSSTLVDAQVLGQDASGLLPYWLDDAGQLVAGTPSGRVQPLHADRYAGPVDAESATTLLREADGLRTLIAVLRGGTVSRLAVGDTAEAEVWKNGVRIS